MNQKISAAYCLVFGLIFSFLSGCSSPCNYPTVGKVHVRIVNAMPDENTITVSLNGKVVAQDFPYQVPTAAGYNTTNVDGTLIQPGSSVPVSVSDANGKVILTGTVLLDFHLQTLIVMGKAHSLPSDNPAKVLRITDDTPPDPQKTLIRFIHAVPDLPALDVFWDTSGKPNATILYGTDNPYMDLTHATSLKITESGNPKNVIFFLPYPAGLIPPGLLVTTIVRGETKPVGADKIASPLLLQDGGLGQYLLSYNTFFVRMVNASRNSNLSLWIRSATVSPEDTLPPRGSGFASGFGVANYPNQEKVLGIPAGITTIYIPLNILLNARTTFFFSKDSSITDTIQWTDVAVSDAKYSKIAVEENPVGTSGKKLSHLNLQDTMSPYPSGNLARVRVINLSPDHPSISVTLAGRTVSMTQTQVEFFDVPIDNATITLKDGAAQNQRTIPVSATIPISVYILPEQTTTPNFPIATSNDN